MDVTIHEFNTFLSGGVMLGFLVAAVFFLRFWTRTRDRLFLLFALAFAVLGAQRFLVLFGPDSDERVVYLYGPRLIGFGLILWAIIDKNRAASRARPAPPSSRGAGARRPTQVPVPPRP
jgi:hypothetical protein